MGQNSAIEWTDHTFNPWWGCTRVSPACAHCYAETLARRTGSAQLWQGERRRTSEANWQQPLRWNRQAQREGRRYRVFSASMADVFDNQVPEDWRQDLWALIFHTPHLDWLLLTKRPQNIAKMLPNDATAWSREVDHKWGWPWPNVWLGTTAENQEEADRRIPHLLAAPAAVRFLSCEPLLGPAHLRSWLRHHNGNCINWVIAGGESGPGARPSHPDWFRGLRDQCAGAGVPFFFKQWGDYKPSFAPDGTAHMLRVPGGKKAAGRLLDGIEHNAFPVPA
jgi:protein gp37